MMWNVIVFMQKWVHKLLSAQFMVCINDLNDNCAEFCNNTKISVMVALQSQLSS